VHKVNSGDKSGLVIGIFNKDSIDCSYNDVYNTVGINAAGSGYN